MTAGILPPESLIQQGIFVQPLAPINGNLLGSFFVGLIPLFIVLLMLGVFRVAAYYSAASGLFASIFIAIFGWQMPAQKAFSAIANGIVYANWPMMWIVVNAMFLYNITIRSGAFNLFRKWMITSTPPDKRVILVIISFCFGALLEGVAGLGVPGAICSSLMVSLGFEAEDALVFTLIFNTTPVAFGSLGTPVTTLASLTGLSALSLSAMMGRQLPFVSVFLPIYTLCMYAGPRAGFIECWPIAAVAGVTFAAVQAIFANWVGPELPDLIAGLISLIVVISFVQKWKPPYRPEYAADMNSVLDGSTNSPSVNEKAIMESTMQRRKDSDKTVAPEEKVVEHQEDEDVSEKDQFENVQIDSESQFATKPEPHQQIIDKLTWKETVLAWSPWVIVIIVVMIWSFAKVSQVGQVNVPWPHLHQEIWLTLYGKKYDAVWNFQPLAIGTAILVATFIFAGIVLLNGSKPRIFLDSIKDTFTQLYRPIITVNLIMAFAYLYNYSGIVYTIGFQLSSVGRAFPFLSAWLGWVACFLSGSDTSANSLFGNLQVVAAREIGLSTILMAATNSAGAITSKMVSPQNLTTGTSTIGLQGKEGRILRRTIAHSLFMCCIMGAMACIQQYLLPGMIPSEQ